MLSFQGKGMMDTYWLRGCDHCPDITDVDYKTYKAKFH